MPQKRKHKHSTDRTYSWRKENPEKYKEYQRQLMRDRREKQKQQEKTMLAATEAPQVSNEEKLSLIQQAYFLLSPLKSDCIPESRSIVIIGSEYDQETLQLAEITKIDGRRVIHTNTGIRFSTKFNWITSTQTRNNRYWSMFDLTQSYDRALKWQEDQRVGLLQRKHSQLKNAVSGLDPIAHADLIAMLLESIESCDK